MQERNGRGLAAQPERCGFEPWVQLIRVAWTVRLARVKPQPRAIGKESESLTEPIDGPQKSLQRSAQLALSSRASLLVRPPSTL